MTEDIEDYSAKEREAYNNVMKYEQTSSSRRIVQLGFVANLLLLVAYFFLVAFACYEFLGRARERTAIMFYFVSFTLIILAALLELWLDLFLQRTVGHGRYCEHNRFWNMVISCLFVLSAIFDIVAFVFWMNRNQDMELNFLFAAAYSVFAMAMLSLYFQTCGRPKPADTPEEDPNTKQEQNWTRKADLIANVLVLIATMVTVVVRHLEKSAAAKNESSDVLEFATAPIWLLSAILFLTTDSMLLRRLL